MNPMYAVAINTGHAADELAKQMADQSQQLNQGALNNGTGASGTSGTAANNVNTTDSSFGQP